MLVRNILDTKGNRVVTAQPGATIAAVSGLLSENRIGAVLVTDESGGIVGVLSERDIVNGLARHGAAVTNLTVADLMTRNVHTCRPGDTIADIMAVMTERHIRHLPVLDDDRLAGMISIGDVVKYRLDEAKLEVDSLREYVQTAH
ncbi:MAG: CBS domain-containing protein [Dongiaceae bacterium]